MTGLCVKQNSIVLWNFRLGFSTAFNIVGLIFLGMALLLKTSTEIKNALSLIKMEHVTTTVMQITLAHGCLSLIAGFITISICSIQINSKPLLYLYAAALFSMVFLQMITGSYILYQRSAVRWDLYGKFEKLPPVDYQSANKRDYQVLRALQLKFECCGFTSGCLDWKTTNQPQLVHISSGCSCDYNPNHDAETCRFYGELNDAKTTCYDTTNEEKALPIRTTPCHNKIADHVENRFTIFGSVLLVFSLAQISGLMAAALSLRQFGLDRGHDLTTPPPPPYDDVIIVEGDVRSEEAVLEE